MWNTLLLAVVAQETQGPLVEVAQVVLEQPHYQHLLFLLITQSQ
jgi:hypothetical protein